MRLRIVILRRVLAMLLATWCGSCVAAPLLRVSADGRHLVEADGTPFFWLGDTAWELFHRLNREEADRYLEDRARKGFTVIQAVAMVDLDGLHSPNPFGHRPLIENDPTRPAVKAGANNDYWDHVDYVVEKAGSLGMFVGLLPTWGDKWAKRWGVGPEIFTPDNAEVYGEFIGRRYSDQPVIWILGGDRNPENDLHLSIIRRMARGIEVGTGGTQLMTFHPQGASNSADWFHKDEWLDFNMVQSGHTRVMDPGHPYIRKNRALKPVKPTLDAEPCYEDHPVMGKAWFARTEPGVTIQWFDEWDVRVEAYKSMLAGACGHTYGNHNIWQMWQPGRVPITAARTPWFDALDHPGARQMTYMRRLFEARPFHEMEPDPSMVLKKPGEVPILAARHKDGAFAIFYLPNGAPLEVDAGKLSGKMLRAWWFNPRQNAAQLIGKFKRSAPRRFLPPSQGRNNDWLLVIDDASRDLPRIGSAYQHFEPVLKD